MVREEGRTIKAFCIWIQVPLFILTNVFGMALAAGYDEVYKNLVSTPRSRFLAGNSKNYRKEVTNISFWSVENGKLEDTMQFSFKEKAKAIIDMSPDGESMVVAFWNLPAEREKYGYTSVNCYSLAEKKWLWRENWLPKSDMARDVRFSPDGLKITVIGYKNIILYEARTGKQLEIIGGPLKEYPPLDLSLQGIFLSSSGRYCVAWQEKPLPGHALLRRLFVSRWVTVWDLQTRKQIARWRRPKYKNFCAAFTQDEKHILFGSIGHIQIWSVEKQRMVREWPLPDFRGVYYLKFSEDYRYLAVYGVSRNFDITIYEYPEGKKSHHFEDVGGGRTEEEPYPMTFFDASNFFAFAKKDQVCVYNTQTWKEKWCYP